MLALTSYVALIVALVLGGVASPIPEEAALVASGVAVGAGALSVTPTVIAGVIGVVIGDLVFYALGFASSRGARLLALPSHAMRARASRLLARWGDGAIVVARFVPGLRSAIFFVAGAMGASPRRVLAIDIVAAAVHVFLLVALGATAHS